MLRRISIIIFGTWFFAHAIYAQAPATQPLDAADQAAIAGVDQLYHAALSAAADAVVARQQLADVTAQLAAANIKLAAVQSPASKTLQSMIDAAPAGSSIVVPNGIYAETPTLMKSLTITAQSVGGVTIDAHGQAYTFTGPPGVAVAGIKFTGAKFGAAHKFAVQANSNWTMTDCAASSDSGGILLKGDKIHLVRCSAIGNGQNGIGGGCTNSILDDCVSIGNNTANYDVTAEAGGGKWTGCDHVTFNNYNCSNNNGPGLWIDGSDTYIAVNGGTFSGNHAGTKTGVAPGIQVEICSGPITISNAAIGGNDNGHGGLTVCESGIGGSVTITGCTFANDQFGMRELVDTKTGKQRLPGLGNISFQHNTLNQSNSYGSSAITPNVVIDYNTYALNAGQPFGYLRGATQTTLAQMCAMGFETHGSTSVATPLPTGGQTSNAQLPTSNSQPATTVRGINLGTIPGNNFNLAIATLKSLGCNSIRFWQYGAFNQPWPADLIAQLKTAHQQGIGAFVTINFQNAVPPCKVGNLADLVAYCNAFPDSSVIGQVYVGIGNEINLSSYFSDTDASYLAALKAVSPILRAKGHKVVLGSESSAQDKTARLLGAGAGPLVDCADLHPYRGNAAYNQAAWENFQSLAAQYKIEPVSSEWGEHQDFSTQQVLAIDIGKLTTYATQKKFAWWYFPLFQTTTPAGPEYLANPDGSLNVVGQAFKAATASN